MTMKSIVAIVLVGLLLTRAQPPLYAQSPAKTNSDEGVSSQAKRSREGFADYALKRINPTDKNYGECIDDARRLLLTATIEDGYFWASVLTIGLSLAFFFVILFQRGLLNRRALIYADALGQYQSALARAEAQAHNASDRNREFMEALRLATDPVARISSLNPSSPAVTPGSISPTVADARESRRKSKVIAPGSAASSGDRNQERSGSVGVAQEPQARSNAVDQPSAFVPGLDLVAQNNALQQQLGLTQDQVKQLRRQLNESERQLQTEKQKNRTVKGE